MMVQLVTNLGLALPFRGVLLSLVPLMQEKKMVALHTLLMIFLNPVKHMFIWMYIFSYYILYVNNNNAYIYLNIVHSLIGSGGGGWSYILSVPFFGLFFFST